MFSPSQPAATESGSLNDCSLDLVSESINMATVPLLMTKNTPGEEQEETEECKEEQEETEECKEEQEETEECKEDQEDSNSLSNGLAIYTQEPQIIISPTSEQTREDKLILDLKSLNCSNELLESVEKFLSWTWDPEILFCTFVFHWRRLRTTVFRWESVHISLLVEQAIGPHYFAANNKSEELWWRTSYAFTSQIWPWSTKPVIRVNFSKLRCMHHLKAE